LTEKLFTCGRFVVTENNAPVHIERQGLIMSRIVQFLLALVLLVGIVGCGNSVADKPADPKSTPTLDADSKAQIDKQKEYYDKTQQSQSQPAEGAK
jgi:hypothetical protein